MARPHSAVFCGSGKLVSCLLPPPPGRRELAGKPQGRVNWSMWKCRAGPDLGVGVASGSQRPREKARGRDRWGQRVPRGWERRMCCRTTAGGLGMRHGEKPGGG